MADSQHALYTPEQVAKFCGVKPATVQGWLEQGQLARQPEDSLVAAEDLLHFMHRRQLAIPQELLHNATQPAADRPPHVLVVDEDRPMASAIEKVIRSMGLEVIQVHNGFDASVTYIKRKPDLMTLDLHLDGMGGLELIKNLRATQTHSAKILVLSEAMPSAMVRARAAGADAVLAKPFDNDSLKRTVRILLGL